MSDQTHAVELWEIDKIIPYEQNAKKHPPEQIEKLAKSIRKFGWTQPIVVWTNGEIIAGHGRRLAAIELGMKKVPVIVRRDLSRPEADALRLADNKVVSTDYDQALVAEEMARLSSELDAELMDAIGYDEKEWSFVTSDLGEINEDFFSDDPDADFEEQREKNQKAVEEADKSASPVVDALGFKRVSLAHSREIRNLMGEIAARDALTPEEILLEALRRMRDAA